MTSQPTFTPTGSGVTSLAGKLARHPGPQPTGLAQATGSKPAGHGSSQQDATDKPVKAARPATALHAGAGALRQITFLAPVPLRTRLRAHLAASHTTMRETLLDAIEHAYPQLDQLLDPTRPTTRRGPLFTRQQAPAHTNQVKVQVSVRLATDEITTIDKLAAQHNAPDRSTLITVALDHHLPAAEGQA
jgi:hypothetical protein